MLSTPSHDLADESPLLRIHQLSLTAASHSILHSIDLAIHCGERVALLGPSGTGKSLLARALTGILPGDVDCEGHIYLNGYDITQRHPAVRPSVARVSMVDQDTASALSPLHTLGQQLMMVCAGAGQTGCGIRRRAESLLEQVGVSLALMERYPAEISGGQRQRVCVALALACDTSLLIADEPTSALDAISQQHVLQALSQAMPEVALGEPLGMSFLKRAQSISAKALENRAPTLSSHLKAVLFITHDLRAAQRLCDRAVVLYDGHIVEDAPMATLLENPQHFFTRQMVAVVRREQQPLDHGHPGMAGNQPGAPGH